jgi:hypothetical protein
MFIQSRIIIIKVIIYIFTTIIIKVISIIIIFTISTTTGLQDSLNSILQAITRSTVLLDYLTAAEEATRSQCIQSPSSLQPPPPPPFDLVTAGIWQPIATVIKERMGGNSTCVVF